mgnify:FL=1
MATFEDGSYSCLPGIALIGKVLAGRCQMKYTRAAVGKGQIPEGSTPKTMTEPADYVMDAKIASVSTPVNGECQVTVQLNSSDVAQGFYATGILLYAEDPDEGEVPYTYLVLENEPEWIRPSSSIVGKLASFDLIAAVDAIDKVIATIDPESMVSREDVERLIAAATVKREVIIPTTGWQTGAEEWPNGKYLDMVHEDVTEEMVPILSVHVGETYSETAEDCGLCRSARTLDGVVRLYAEKDPAAEIPATLLLLNASNGQAGEGGAGGYVLPIASATTLGGVKIGENISVTPDGTISATGASVSDDDIVTSDETDEMLDEIFSPEP